jgi:hypothetical protein
MGNAMRKSLLVAFLTALMVCGFALAGTAHFCTVQASTDASGIPKPSVPEFTLELVGPPYYVNTTYSLDPNTGQIVAKIGYTNPYSALKINVKNQPFSDSYGDLYYNVRVKNHSVTDNWVEAYRVAHFFPKQSNDSDYTNVGFSIQGYNFIGTLAGCQVDIQVEAMLGRIGRVSTSIGGYGFIGETSGWSETQTISIPANTPLSPTPSPSTSPSQSQQTEQLEIIIGAAIAVAVIAAGLSLLIYLIKRK